MRLGGDHGGGHEDDMNSHETWWRSCGGHEDDMNSRETWWRSCGET